MSYMLHKREENSEIESSIIRMAKLVAPINFFKRNRIQKEWINNFYKGWNIIYPGNITFDHNYYLLPDNLTINGSVIVGDP